MRNTGIVLNFPDLIQQKVPGGCLASYIIHSLFIIILFMHVWLTVWTLPMVLIFGTEELISTTFLLNFVL